MENHLRARLTWKKVQKVNEKSNIFNNEVSENIDEEYFPKLFSDDSNKEDNQTQETEDDKISDQLFEQEVNEEEDFEIPAFLRRQKF